MFVVVVVDGELLLLHLIPEIYLLDLVKIGGVIAEILLMLSFGG